MYIEFFFLLPSSVSQCGCIATMTKKLLATSSPVEEHVSCFHSLANRNKTAMNIWEKLCIHTGLHFSRINGQECNLLGQMVSMCNILETAKLMSRVSVIILHSHRTVPCVSDAIPPHTYIWYYHSFSFCCSDR